MKKLTTLIKMVNNDCSFKIFFQTTLKEGIFVDSQRDSSFINNNQFHEIIFMGVIEPWLSIQGYYVRHKTEKVLSKAFATKMK